MSFFVGATFSNVFGDLSPLVEGQTRGMLPEYQERWNRYDVFSTPGARRQLVGSGVSSLSELATVGRCPPRPRPTCATSSRELGNGVRDGHAPGTADGHTALVGMFDPARKGWAPPELAALRLLARQVSAISRHLPVTRRRAALAGLSERQRQVVVLVADGMSNAQIAEALSLAEDSVKKYVSRILTATGCQSRMDLALLARSAV